MSLKLNPNLKIKLNNGKHIHYNYMSDFDNPIFRLDETEIKITIIDDKLYYVSDGDYDEPEFQLKEDYQATEFFKKYSYNFNEERFVECEHL